MSRTILITGANGRLGQAAIREFAGRGWRINTLVRKHADDLSAGQPVNEFIGDVCDFQLFHAAALGCDVILHAANPSYEHWASVLPPSISTLIEVAKSVNATIVMPGNVYPYGEHMPPLLTPDKAHLPGCEPAELRAQLEQRLQAAAAEQGVQTLLVRAGGYIDGRDTGNWFESYMCKDLHRGRFMYPGAMDTECAWVYLPDVASVMAQVTERRDNLALYEDIGVPGFSVTGTQMHNAVQAHCGQSFKLTSIPWFFIRLAGWFKPQMKAVYDLRYLFFVPHRIDGTRLQQILPDWQSTTLQDTLAAIDLPTENQLPAQTLTQH
ncbi:MAG: NAD-dependent epimerase/dehydratase family protein [Pseudomonadota bacterium]